MTHGCPAVGTELGVTSASSLLAVSRQKEKESRVSHVMDIHDPNTGEMISVSGLAGPQTTATMTVVYYDYYYLFYFFYERLNKNVAATTFRVTTAGSGQEQIASSCLSRQMVHQATASLPPPSALVVLFFLFFFYSALNSTAPGECCNDYQLGLNEKSLAGVHQRG